MQRGAGSGVALVEAIRLAVVLATTAAGHAVGGELPALGGLEAGDEVRLLSVVLGALLGYILGGVVGRGLVRGVDAASVRLRRVPATRLVSASLGATLGAVLGLLLLVPVSLLPYRWITVPVGLAVLIALAALAARLGADRGEELSRFLGVRGRLDVVTPSRGGGVKVVDSSALIDGRIAEVARTGFLEGVLVVPGFVIDEVSRIAESPDEHRRRLGERGLETLRTLQDEGLVAVEVDDEPVEGVGEVDEKLAALCRQRRAGLVTGDAALAANVERSGVRVLNPHALADAVRSPVLPGERLELTVVREGRQAGQGVAYLDDGTMVVIDDAATLVGGRVEVDVTAIVQRRTGRLLFAAPRPDPA